MKKPQSKFSKLQQANKQKHTEQFDVKEIQEISTDASAALLKVTTDEVADQFHLELPTDLAGP